MHEVFINKVEYFLPNKIELNSKILKKAGKNISDIKKWTEKIGIKSRRIVKVGSYVRNGLFSRIVSAF